MSRFGHRRGINSPLFAEHRANIGEGKPVSSNVYRVPDPPAGNGSLSDEFRSLSPHEVVPSRPFRSVSRVSYCAELVERSVPVASVQRQSRSFAFQSVASESPRSVLSSTLHQCRRAAATIKCMRWSSSPIRSSNLYCLNVARSTVRFASRCLTEFVSRVSW